MFIALGIIGALWFAGMVIWPDKNAPPVSSQNPPPHIAATVSPARSAETRAN